MKQYNIVLDIECTIIICIIIKTEHLNIAISVIPVF